MEKNDQGEIFEGLEGYFNLPLLRMELQFNSNFIKFFEDVVKKQRESEADGLSIVSHGGNNLCRK